MEVRNNRLLEQQVKRLDKKIELLIKNRITLEEVLNTPKSSLLSKTKFRGSLNVDEASLKDPKMLDVSYLRCSRDNYEAAKWCGLVSRERRIRNRPFSSVG